MKLGEIINLFEGFTKIKLSKTDIKFSELRKLNQLRTSLKNDAELFFEQKMELLRKYGTESEFKQGEFKLHDAVGFHKALTELRNEEIEFSFPEIDLPVTIPVTDNLYLNEDNYEALLPYINFTEDNI